MAYEGPGGLPDKLGNEYESMWVVKQLIRLLHEDIQSICWEPVGPDENGVDAWVTHKDGCREAYQCKGRNGSSEKWTVADLGRAGILKKMRYQLGRSQTAKFTLVSPLPCTRLYDICESARYSSGPAKNFKKYQIDGIGQDRQADFKKYCSELDAESPEIDLETAYNFLKRTDFDMWLGGRQCFNDILSFLKSLYDGNPSFLYEVIERYAKDHYREEITVNAIEAHLVDQGFNPRRLARDGRILPEITRLKSRFKSLIKPVLINGELLPRKESQSVMQKIVSNSVVILHGAAGVGKSGVIYEITEKLDEQDITYIPIRLDRNEPQNTTKEFGISLGLPESPVLCLDSLAGSHKHTVLILDQLDALRWTNMHSGNALDVCKELLKEVQAFQRAGRSISVVIACRTHDLQHDPEIKAWLGKGIDIKCYREEVSLLPENTSKEIITSLGYAYDEMRTTQKQILRSPLHLAIWANIAGSSKAPVFKTKIDLIDKFFEDVFRKLHSTDISNDKANDALDEIVGYMDANSKLFAPNSLISSEPAVLQELKSLGVLTISDNKISFSHQGYLDYKIAKQVLRNIYTGNKTIIDWLGCLEDQSLFKRDQLRQALVLLSEEDSSEFVIAVKQILKDSEIRFHIKHLVLEVLSNVDLPTDALLEFLMELRQDPFWEDHLLSVVFWGRQNYIRHLIDKSIIQEWLDSGDENKINNALRMLRSIASSEPDLIVEILEPYLNSGEQWNSRLLRCIGRDVENDSSRMFELRLQLLESGVYEPWINWPGLIKEFPYRAIQLLGAFYSQWNAADLKEYYDSNESSIISHWKFYDEKHISAFINLAELHPVKIWNTLLGHIIRLTSDSKGTFESHMIWFEDRERLLGRGINSNAKILALLLVNAGKEIAHRCGFRFFERNSSVYETSLMLQRILVEVFYELPCADSDKVLGWLMDNTSRFAVGSGYREPKWKLTSRLITKFSVCCSDHMFDKLSDYLIHYHQADELRWAKDYLPLRRSNGVFYDYWGRSQYFLLPALDKQKRSSTVEGLIGVLNRRYEGYYKDEFLSGIHDCEDASSDKLKHQLETVSDRTWLLLVSNNKLSKSRSEPKLSSILSDMSRRFPERFGRLALKFSVDVNPSYVKAVLRGLGSKPSDDVKQDESWIPARHSVVEEVLGRFCHINDKFYAMEFCRIVKERSEEEWSQKIIDQIIYYAIEHDNPSSGYLVGFSGSKKGIDECSVNDLFDTTINCVRGTATLTICNILYDHSDLIDVFRDCLNTLVQDKHPAVRIGAIYAILPILNLDVDWAVNLFCIASENDRRVSASRYAYYYFNHAIESHFQKLSPIVKNMIDSKFQDVAEKGAIQAATKWIYYGLFESEVEKCKKGSVAHRKGMAYVASNLLLKEKYFSQSLEILIPLLNDVEQEVRAKISDVFRGGEIFKLTDGKTFIDEYVKSQAFLDDQSSLLFAFESHPGSLIDYSDTILNICEQMVGVLKESDRKPGRSAYIETHYLFPIIMRLYEQAESIGNTQVVSRCLDSWDLLYKNDIDNVRELTNSIDQ